jgi:hypothetical protein
MRGLAPATRVGSRHWVTSGSVGGLAISNERLQLASDVTAAKWHPMLNLDVPCVSEGSPARLGGSGTGVLVQAFAY